MSEQNTEFDINQPFVTQEQKFKYWEESKAHIKEANKRIAALEGEVKVLDQLYRDACENSYKFGELQANNNDLREALEKLKNEVKHELNVSFVADIEKALSATPAESLQAHDDMTIEKCAKVAEGWGTTGADALAKSIRVLKGK